LLVEEAKNTEEPQPVTPAAQQASSGAWKLKLHLLGTLIFTMLAYVIPLSFTSYLFSSEAKSSVHTMVDSE